MHGAPASAGATRPAGGCPGTRAGLRGAGAAARAVFFSGNAHAARGKTVMPAATGGRHVRGGLQAGRRARPWTRYVALTID